MNSVQVKIIKSILKASKELEHNIQRNYKERKQTKEWDEMFLELFFNDDKWFRFKYKECGMTL